MATVRETRLIDDLDKTDAAGTVTLALDGRTYEIDLSAANAARLRDELAPFVAAGRRTPNTRGRAQGRRSAPTGDRTHPQVIRIWARQEGLIVSDRGRVPVAVQDAYAAAH